MDTTDKPTRLLIDDKVELMRSLTAEGKKQMNTLIDAFDRMGVVVVGATAGVGQALDSLRKGMERVETLPTIAFPHNDRILDLKETFRRKNSEAVHREIEPQLLERMYGVTGRPGPHFAYSTPWAFMSRKERKAKRPIKLAAEALARGEHRYYSGAKLARKAAKGQIGGVK